MALVAATSMRPIVAWPATANLPSEWRDLTATELSAVPAAMQAAIASSKCRLVRADSNEHLSHVSCMSASYPAPMPHFLSQATTDAQAHALKDEAVIAALTTPPSTKRKAQQISAAPPASAPPPPAKRAATATTRPAPLVSAGTTPQKADLALIKVPAVKKALKSQVRIILQAVKKTFLPTEVATHRAEFKVRIGGACR